METAVVMFRARLVAKGKEVLLQCCECEATSTSWLASSVVHTDNCPARQPDFYSKVEDEEKEKKKGKVA